MKTSFQESMRIYARTINHYRDSEVCQEHNSFMAMVRSGKGMFSPRYCKEQRVEYLQIEMTRARICWKEIEVRYLARQLKDHFHPANIPSGMMG